jgi:hypothetical protein
MVQKGLSLGFYIWARRGVPAEKKEIAKFKHPAEPYTDIKTIDSQRNPLRLLRYNT